MLPLLENIINTAIFSMRQPVAGAGAATPIPPGDGQVEIAVEVQAQLERLLNSPHFFKARRAGPLLRYMVSALYRPSAEKIGEFEIGIELFRRDPRTYSPADDPVVRVQVGRLRRRLEAYYESDGKNDPVRITIPAGAYVAHIERFSVDIENKRLAFVPNACTSDRGGCDFIHGLNDEIIHRLHLELGADFVMLPASSPGLEPGGRARTAGVTHVLESSVRVDRTSARANLRLFDIAMATIVWSDQFDLDGDLSIARQEVVAESCCRAVRDCLRPAAA
ncbi:hypothetical protein HH212_19605 [Massilia forsythiae]|uniref:Uncharacterized protein n=1 Tax=Massilia forsythiae TaxID=2728020 RepID=A0A7Z2VYY2_9BURK|nr:hypothetical protein [Massilia forsythiae]QJE01952.1 hypothetical protein HH212_19605 [Massilia forsythiae]